MLSESKLSKGDRVRVRASGTNDDWCEGVVLIASANGRAAAMSLAGMVRANGGFIGGILPFFIDPVQETVTGLDDTEYELEVTC